MSFLELASNSQKKAILKKIGTTEQQIANDVKTIKTWLGTQPHLPEITDDEMIKSFLIGCKNSIERTKQKLDAYYTVRNQIPEFFKNRDPQEYHFSQALEATSFATLPDLTKDRARVHMGRLDVEEASRYDVPNYLKRVLMVMELYLREESYVHGIYILLDAKHFTLGHAVRLTPMLIKNFLHCMQDVMPMKMKGLIIINSPPLVDITVNRVLKPFLKKKLADRVHIYSEDHRVLTNHFPSEMLPKDYGGNADPITKLNRTWTKLMESKRDWLMTKGSVGTDESKRPNKDKPGPHCLFGTDGTFKKLCID